MLSNNILYDLAKTEFYIRECMYHQLMMKLVVNKYLDNKYD